MRNVFRCLSRAALALGFVASAVSPPDATAAPLLYTGELRADNGLPYTGTVEVSVSVYDTMSGGTALWSSAPSEEAVMGGLLGLRIAEPALDALIAAHPQLWLEFEIDGEVLAPRQEVGRVPFAVVAGDAATLGGMSSGDFMAAGDTISESALPTNGIGRVSNYALNNAFDDVTYTWTGNSNIGDNPDPGGTASVMSAETDNSYLTSLSLQTSYELLFASLVEVVLYPPPASGFGPITLETGMKGVGVHAATWTPANTPALAALLGNKVEGQWTVTVSDLDNNAAPGVIVGKLTLLSVKYDVVRSDHLQVAGKLDVEGDLTVGGGGSFAEPVIAPGLSVQTKVYRSTASYSATTSWQDGPTFTFSKMLPNSDLLVQGAFPFYITPGSSGYGLRLQYSTDNSTWTDAGLTAGPAHGWGTGGYGGSTAGVSPFFELLQGITTTGTLYFRFQIMKWDNSDTLTFISHPGYTKRATWTVQEIAN